MILAFRRILPLLAYALLLQVGLKAASASTDGNQKSTASLQAGYTDFNATDRFAITNVIMAMTNGLDEKNIDLMVSNLAPEFSVEYRLPGLDPIKIEGRANFAKMMAKRFENLSTDGIERRHIISPLYFIKQLQDSAKVLIQILTCTATRQANWRPFSSAKVEFMLRKQDGIWLCNQQLETLDCPLDLPVSKVVPLTGLN